MELIIDGIRTFCYRTGSAGKNLVFLHGWGTDHTSFLPVIEKVKDRYMIYAPDLPGFGKTDEPDIAYDAQDYAEFVRELIDKARIEDPVIIGHSNGGRIAIVLAGLIRIKKMILIDSAGIMPKRKPQYYLKVCSYKLIKKILTFFRCRDMLEKYSKNKGSEDYKKASEKMKAVFKNLVNEDQRKLLSAIESSVLLFWGENDQETPLSDAQAMNESIRDSGLVVVKKGGHYSYLDDIGLFIRVLDKFLEG